MAATVWLLTLLDTALHATVPSSASPIEPPICCPVLTRLEATPLSSGNVVLTYHVA